MKQDIFLSKLQIPIVPKGLVVRSRLIARLQNAQKRVCILHATVGYGKTVFMAQYVRSCDADCAWYHLQETDNDPMAFLEYLICAAEQATGCTILDLRAYHSMTQKKSRLRRIAMDFAASLEQVLQEKNRRFVLALDDFQTITNEEIWNLLDDIILSTTERVQFLVATKGAVAPFWMRHILSGAGEIIKQEVLSCTLDETTAILQQEIGREDLTQTAQQVQQAVEGWPAGVMFAALYLKQNPNLDALNPCYEKSMVNSYLMHELYRKLPYEIQQFLAGTSILEDLRADVCNAVLKIHDADSMLSYLMQENLFIVRTGKDGKSYRYHSLFRAFLQTQLRGSMREQVLQAAVRFYLQSANRVQAVEYAILLGDTDLMQETMQYTCEEVLQESRLNTLSRWLLWLRAHNAVLTPTVTLYSGIYAYRTGDREQGFAQVETAKNQAQAQGQQTVYQRCLLAQMRMTQDRCSLAERAEMLTTFSQEISAENRTLWITVALERLYHMLFLGQETQAAQACQQLLQQAQKAHWRDAERQLKWFQCIIGFYLGRYAQMQAQAQALEQEGIPAMPFSVHAYLAMLRWFQGDGEAAFAKIEDALAQQLSQNNREDLWLIWLFRAYLAMATQRTQEAAYSIEMARQRMEDWPPNHVFPQYVALMQFVLSAPPEALPEESLLEGVHPFFQHLVFWTVLQRGTATQQAQAIQESLAKRFAQTEPQDYFIAAIQAALPQVQEKKAQAFAAQNALCLPCLSSAAPQETPPAEPQTAFPEPKAARTASDKLTVHCFGGFAIYPPQTDTPIKWRTRRAMRLAAYLFHEQGKPVDREKLLALFWPEAERNNAAALLNTTLYSIRKGLAQFGFEKLIVYENKSYRMDMNLIHSDIDALHAAESAAAQHKALTDTQWLCCCEGAYLEGLEDAFYTEVRAWYEHRVLTLCGQMAQLAQEEHAYAKALSYYRCAIRIDPYQETYYTKMLYCCQAMGEVHQAKELYAAITERLRTELDIEPTAELQQAYTACLQGRKTE